MRVCCRLAAGSLFAALFATLFASASLAADGPSLLPDDAPIQPVSTDFELVDGAAWDGQSRLFVPDVKGKKLLVFNLRNPKAKVVERLKGIAISGTSFQLGKLHFADNPGARICVLGQSGPPQTLAQFEKTERPNDLTVDCNGNVFVTVTGKGLVRKVLPDGTTQDIATGLVTPNGIALSPSGQTLYVSSAKSGKLYRMDLTTSAAADQAATDFAQLPETADGFRGDGMCVDRAGNVYVTAAKAVHVYDPTGTEIQTITPPERPINAIIAGAVTEKLYLSTFGGLYSVPVNAYGVVPNRATDDDSDRATSTRIPKNINAKFNQVYHTDGSRKLLMDLFTPTEGPSVKPAIVVVHGGGWKNGDKNKFRALAVHFAKRGYVVAAIEYRLAREAFFPAGIQDCNAATIYLRQHAKQLGIDPNRIAAVGGSAGGHLVGLMASGSQNPKLRHTQHQQANSHLAAAAVLAGPLQTTSGSVAERSQSAKPPVSNAFLWLNGTLPEKPELYRLADAHQQIDSNMPPTIFLSGSKDTPERNALSRTKMTELGIANQIVVHQDATHGHWNRDDWIEQVVSDIDAFFDKHLNN